MGGVVGFTAKRLLWAVPVLLVVLTATFFLLRMVPGGPYDREKALPPAVEANLLARADLDQPMTTQYLRFVSRTLRGDLDWSMKYPDRRVSEVLVEAFPVSLALGFLAAVLALIGGVVTGCLAAVRRGKLLDQGITFAAALGFSLPSFVLGTVLILFFALSLGWLPPGLWEGPSYYVLPAVTLAAAPAAFVAQLTRSGMIDTLAADYVRTAKAKGASPARVVFRHALRNALGPVLTVMGPIVAWLITGSFIVEFIFSIPGLGRHFVSAVINRDYTLVMGTTLVYAVVVVLANLGVDLAYGLVDPR
ncbi:MAG: ABC transporter permease, partial [Myxococcales bacterium]|nr:ABC transporter permease [Myxococcales bacterium]